MILELCLIKKINNYAHTFISIKLKDALTFSSFVMNISKKLYRFRLNKILNIGLGYSLEVLNAFKEIFGNKLWVSSDSLIIKDQN